MDCGAENAKREAAEPEPVWPPCRRFTQLKESKLVGGGRADRLLEVRRHHALCEFRASLLHSGY